MRNNPVSIVLASASPRRSELLSLAGICFEIAVSDIDESVMSGEPAVEYALRLSEQKAKAVADMAQKGCWIIGADTVVVLDERILGKPEDAEDAVRMLGLLSDRPHEVITAFTIYNHADKVTVQRAVSTTVIFRSITKEEIDSYVQTGCPLDKAGAYAIQGGAAHFVREIRGSYTNVVGLPTCELLESLKLVGAY